MTVKDLKDAMLEYVKADPSWNTMTEDARNALIFCIPVATIGLFGEIVLKPDTTQITLIDVIDSIINLRNAENKFNKKN